MMREKMQRFRDRAGPSATPATPATAPKKGAALETGRLAPSEPAKRGARIMAKAYESWGKYPKAEPANVEKLYWRDDTVQIDALPGPVLAYAKGRSYGDCCLNEGGTLLDTTALTHFIDFDAEQGVLRCEAGVTFEQLLEVIVPRGWFPPVTPGTKFVSIGGAIANDVHGKNHHRGGTFGRHVTRIGLLRSNGERLVCSLTENSELYQATIGGLGLTGLIEWAEFRLKRIPGSFVEVERLRFASLEEFFELSAHSEEKYEYTVAWLDCLTGGTSLGRGIFMRGNHVPSPFVERRSLRLDVPFDFPEFALNRVTMKLFNLAVYHSQRRDTVTHVVHYDPFFYPLDIIGHWNRIYGSRGFMQYQFVVPFDDNFAAIRALVRRITEANSAFLTVFKTFGDVPSPGMLSFPRPGVTLAVDFPHKGEATLKLFDRLDKMVQDAGGALYPAKDARMSAEAFQSYFPRWEEFSKYVDPAFSSNFWRRVTATTGDGRT